MDDEIGKKILILRDKVVPNFTAGDWEEIGLITGFSDIISNHPRLMRSLSWRDPDYPGNVLSIIKHIAKYDETKFSKFENFVREKYPEKGQSVSSKLSVPEITFSPIVFKVPENPKVDKNLVSIMMSFNPEFDSVHDGIKRACTEARYRCLRVDDIWEDSTIIQDIFNLILTSYIVIVDFSGKNSNVMYETGIAHTLGKHVIPITQSMSDVPFDIQHHRVLKYMPNTEGISNMVKKLTEKLNSIT
jgi:hypothetical protein